SIRPVGIGLIARRRRAGRRSAPERRLPEAVGQLLEIVREVEQLLPVHVTRGELFRQTPQLDSPLPVMGGARLRAYGPRGRHGPISWNYHKLNTGLSASLHSIAQEVRRVG